MYMDHSQDPRPAFLRSGIVAATAMNAGALIAVLTAISAYSGENYIDGVTCAVKDWAVGATLGIVAWFVATFSAQAQMQSADGAGPSRVSTAIWLVLLTGAVGCFVWGGFTFANAIDASR